MNYRPEIDGLRALAVVQVILFHAGIANFSGGYVGVDIFFVISGYLITSIIVNEIEKDKFSIVNFYERRARRILPALFLVVLACLPAAWLWLMPAQLRDFSQSLIAVIFFVSNVFFWRSVSYFAESSDLTPLLHTWSLSIEEQFYLLFPIIVLLLFRYGIFYVMVVITIISAASLAFAEWAIHLMPAASFYLIPTRAWELGAGALCALLLHGRSPWKNDALAFLGLGLIAFSIFAYDARTPFPSLYTLVPVGGTALVILCAGSATGAARFLSMRPLVGIGLISYSAYLWHQPLFAFARLRSPEEPGIALMASLIVATFGLAWASWRYVEQPFRRKPVPVLVSRRAVFGTAAAMSGLLVVAGLYGQGSQGAPFRFAPDDRDFVLALDSETLGAYTENRFDDLVLMPFPDNDRKNIMIVGDSFSQDLINMIYENDLNSFVNISTYKIHAQCGNFYLEGEALYRATRNMPPHCKGITRYKDPDLQRLLVQADYVILASSWQDWHLEFIPETLARIDAATDATIVVLGRKSFGTISPWKILSVSPEERNHLSNGFGEGHADVNRRLRDMVPNFIDLSLMLCGSEERCRIFTDDGHLISYDGSHLTADGAAFSGKIIIERSPLFQEIFGISTSRKPQN